MRSLLLSSPLLLLQPSFLFLGASGALADEDVITVTFLQTWTPCCVSAVACETSVVCCRVGAGARQAGRETLGLEAGKPSGLIKARQGCLKPSLSCEGRPQGKEVGVTVGRSGAAHQAAFP